MCFKDIVVWGIFTFVSVVETKNVLTTPCGFHTMLSQLLLGRAHVS